MRGRKPKPAVVKQVTGNPGKRPIAPEVVVEGAPVKPHWLTGRGAEIWEEVLAFAYWLTRADSYVLAAWCDREADYENPRKRSKWKAADRRQHLSCAAEIGLTSTSRTRMAISDPAAKNRGIAPTGQANGQEQKPAAAKDGAAKYLN